MLCDATRCNALQVERLAAAFGLRVIMPQDVVQSAVAAAVADGSADGSADGGAEGELGVPSLGRRAASILQEGGVA